MLKLAKNKAFTFLCRHWAWERFVASLFLVVVLGLQAFGLSADAMTGASTPLGGQTLISAAPTLVQTKVDAAPKVFTPPSVQDVLLGVCIARGYGVDCAKTLLGMLWKESNNIPTAIGDRGKSHGYFQIQLKLHKVTLACARDLRCSADWTITYMERHGYPTYVKHAVQCHNGCLVNNGYSASAIRHGKRLWNTPLEYRATETYTIAAISQIRKP